LISIPVLNYLVLNIHEKGLVVVMVEDFILIFCSWQKRLASAGVKLGLVGNICLAFLFFPVVRSSSVLPLLGLTPESCIKYHIWLGHIAMTLFTAHGIFFIVYWAVTHQLSKVHLHILTTIYPLSLVPFEMSAFHKVNVK